MKKLMIILVPTALFFFADKLNAQIPNETAHDLVAATLILEAGGEKDQRAMLAVWEVLRNRAKQQNKSIVSVCFQRKQFSCWNNVEKRQALFDKASKHPKFNKAYDIATKNYKTNVTNGATHYHTLKVNPYWSKSYEKTVVIENHIFYR
jgi:spore germination cell wall hydrolase CwlJ-like protein